MQKYTYLPSLVIQTATSTCTKLPTIVDACSTYVGTKGLNIQCGVNVGFIPIVANNNSNASCVKVDFSGTTCAVEYLQPSAYFCATACSVYCTTDTYDPGTFTTYIKGFTFCYRDPFHSCCPFAICKYIDICLCTNDIGWKCMGRIECGCYQMTASTYQFCNNCIAQYRTIYVYIRPQYATANTMIGIITTYMPSRPIPGSSTCCITNCNGVIDILNYIV